MMTAMVPVVVARQRPNAGSRVVIFGATALSVFLGLGTISVVARFGGVIDSRLPISLALGAAVLGLEGLALVALGRRRLGTAWVVSAAGVSAGSLAQVWVDAIVDFSPRLSPPVGPPLDVLGALGRLSIVGGLGAAVLAASVLVGRPGRPQRSLVCFGAAAVILVLSGVAVDPGSVDPTLNDVFGPLNPLAPLFELELAAHLVRLVGWLGLGAVVAAGLLPVARALGPSTRAQVVVAAPVIIGVVAGVLGLRWATVAAVVIPTVLFSAEVVVGGAVTTAGAWPALRGTGDSAIERQIDGGLSVGRLVALAWAVLLVIAGSNARVPFEAASIVWVLFAAAGVVTLVQLGQRGALDGPRSRALVAAEAAVGLGFAVFGASLGDGFADPGALPPPGWPWPLVGILAVGVVFGPVVGAGWGITLGFVRLLIDLAASGATEDLELLSRVNTLGLYAVCGTLAGLVVGRLRRAEAEIAAARAREEVARALHDGVMQSLAVIRRRAEPEVARMAADADRELRTYLARGEGAPDGLAQVLRDTVDAVAVTQGIEPVLALDPELPELTAERLVAVRGIVTEALANAAKHAGANHITVYAGPDLADHQTMVAVRDDGVGFDMERVPQDRGLARSMRGRAAEAGMRLEIRSERGGGTEVCLWL